MGKRKKETERERKMRRKSWRRFIFQYVKKYYHMWGASVE